MAKKTIQQLQDVAKSISNETVEGGNSKTRIGGEFLDVIDTFDDKATSEAGLRSGADANLQALISANADMTAAADIYNVTQKIPLGTYYTPETARAAVPVAIRKTGLIITYRISVYVWVMEQYGSSSVSNSYWNMPDNWTKIWESTYPATAVMTESAYDALPEKDPFTLYFIK